MKKIRLPVLVCFLTILYVYAHAQHRDTLNRYKSQKRLSLLLGYNGGGGNFLEAGVSVNNLGAGHHPAGTAYFASGEVKPGKLTVVGPKIGAWFGGGVAMGANMIYYTDFNKGSLVFRPEIGLGFDRFKMVYGYNAKITNTSFDKIGKNVLGIAICLELKRLKKEGE